jgi:hypothetical protein
MAYRRKSWTEKLADDKGLPKIIRMEGKMTLKWGEGTMVIPAPREVDAEMREIKRGRLATIHHLRTQLAEKHNADLGCPITTGIFAWIAAHAAAEQEAAGKKRVTPWWRTVKTGGELNPKYPGGCEEQARRLRAEGHRVERKGKRWVVALAK